MGMQDTRTGAVVPISEEEYSKRKADGSAPVFRIGELVTVNGGHFRVRKITRKDLVLRGVPAGMEK
jgi:hypothetical protein